MTITPQAILNAAYGKSKKNQPGRIANEAVELLGEVNIAVRALFMYAARMNPYFFMSSANVSYSSGWAFPAGAEAIFRIEFTATGVEVITVPLNDKEAETGEAAVYRVGQVFFGAGNTLDPTNEDLTFYYSKSPTDAPNLSPGTIDVLFPDTYQEVLNLQIAKYLAIKDGRIDEGAMLQTQIDKWTLLFMAHLEHETMNLRERWGPPEPFNTSSMLALGSILGGSAPEGA